MPQEDKSLIDLSIKPLLWSNGDLFTGFILLGLGLPTASINVSKVGYQVENEFVRCPTEVFQRINKGVLESFYVYRTDKLTPPGTRYYAYFYDLSNRLVAPTMGNASPLNINTPSFIITPPTLTIPTASTSSPSYFTSGEFK